MNINKSVFEHEGPDNESKGSGDGDNEGSDDGAEFEETKETILQGLDSESKVFIILILFQPLG